MTAFGVTPTSTSPAARRIYEAGERFAADSAFPALQREQEKIARCAEEARGAKLRARRMRLIDRFEQAFRATKDAPAPKGVPHLSELLTEVCAKHRLSKLDMKSKRRTRPLARARFEFYWRARHETTKSLPEIGRFLGFDHTSVMNGIRRHEELTREAQ